MRIDATTLGDLEVFGATDGRGGLFELLDKTATSIGRSALRRRVSVPSSRISEIRRTQDAVRFLLDHPELVRLDGALVDVVSQYLRSNVETRDVHPLMERVERTWMSMRYPAILEELEEGTRATVTLFASLRPVMVGLLAHDPPEVIHEMAVRISESAEAVLRDGGGLNRGMRRDRILREELRADIEGTLALLGELDALNAMAQATRSLGWAMPDLVEEEAFVLEADAIYHPFLRNAVTNPISLSGGEPLLFLTGPNMAGKTTYLKSVALVVLLAQVGMGVPAARARVTPVEVLFTSLNPADNLRAGLSYFLAEVMRVKEAAQLLAQGRRALVLFDEVFKGTNVRDALDASAEVIRGFARARRSGFIFSSHLTELVEVLKPMERIRFCCFDGEIVEGAPHYGFKLRDGVSEKRFGLLLLRQAEVPELLARIA
jgi:DNA mismatch repair protein MutS